MTTTKNCSVLLGQNKHANSKALYFEAQPGKLLDLKFG